MTAKEARTRDDGRDDPDNPIVPFRMSDRIQLNGVELKVNILTAIAVLTASLVAGGMALHYL